MPTRYKQLDYADCFLGSKIFADKMVDSLKFGWKWMAFGRREIQAAMGTDFPIDRNHMNLLAASLKDHDITSAVETFIFTDCEHYFLILPKTMKDYFDARSVVAKAIKAITDKNGNAIDLIIQH